MWKWLDPAPRNTATGSGRLNGDFGTRAPDCCRGAAGSPHLPIHRNAVRFVQLGTRSAGERRDPIKFRAVTQLKAQPLHASLTRFVATNAAFQLPAQS